MTQQPAMYPLNIPLCLSQQNSIMLLKKKAESLISGLKSTQITFINLSYYIIPCDSAKEFFGSLRDTNINKLILSGVEIKTKGFKALAKGLKGSKVTHLEITIVNLLGIDGVKMLADTLKFTEVTHLKFCVLMQGKDFMKTIVKCLVKSKIKTLDLSYNDMGEEGAAAIAEGLKHTGLIELNLSTNNIGDKGVSSLGKYLKHTKIQKLDLTNNNIGRIGVQSLIKALEGSELINLIITKNSIGFLDAQVLCENIQNTKIKNISIGCIDSENEGLVSLLQCLKNSQMQEVILSCDYASQKTLRVFKRNLVDLISVSHFDLLGIPSYYGDGTLHLQPNKAVQWLEVNTMVECFVGEERAQILSEGMKFSQITHLDLNFNKIGVGGAADLANCLKDTKIVCLSLKHSLLQDKGAEALAEGLRNTMIKHLDLSWNMIGFLGAKSLARCIRDSLITYFNFNMNPMPKEGAFCFADCFKYSKIKHISFDFNDIEDEGAEALFEGMRGSNVANISLSGNGITDQGVFALCKYIKDTKLSSLCLGRNCITEKGVEALTEALKSTGVTQLNLSDNLIDLESIQSIATCLRDTEIIEIILNGECLTEEAAMALVEGIKDTQVTKVILTPHDLAWSLECSGIKELKDTHLLCIDLDLEFFEFGTYIKLRSILYDNWKNAQQLIKIFNEVIHTMDDGMLEFSPKVESVDDIYHYIDLSLVLTKTLTEMPGMISHIKNNGEQEQYCSDVLRKFVIDIPYKLSVFISRIEGSVDEHIDILKKVEDSKCFDVIKVLLLHRPIYMIENESGILHPYVYKLLKKYGLPMYNPELEPDKKKIIYFYFLAHLEIEGAKEICDMLEAM